jgi:hypothetical protein
MAIKNRPAGLRAWKSDALPDLPHLPLLPHLPDLQDLQELQNNLISTVHLLSRLSAKTCSSLRTTEPLFYSTDSFFERYGLR